MTKDISMSDLLTFKRCQYRSFNQRVRGLEPRATNRKMLIGTVTHACWATGYRMEQGRAMNPNNVVYTSSNLSAMLDTLQSMWGRGFTDHDRFYPPESFSREDKDLMEDMLTFWWDNRGKNDRYEILKVEEPIYVQIGDWTVRGTFDALVRDEGHLLVVDKKTVDSVGDTESWLPLDFQHWLYQFIGWKTFGEPVDFMLDRVRREVPPGFGHRAVRLTKKGVPAANNASTDPDDYLQRVPVPAKTESELRAFESELINLLATVEGADTRGYYTRTEIRTGSQSCGGCPYKAVCESEYYGNVVGDEVLNVMFDRKAPNGFRPNV
jgi:hypothetical protein